MNYRRLGRTDIRLSEICFGMASLTGRKGPAAASAEVMHRAADAVRQALGAGITSFHIGPGYESGFILKDLVRSAADRERLQLIVKLAGPTFQETAFSAATVTRTVERMLSDTGFESIAVGQYIFQGRGIAEGDKSRMFAGDLQAAVAECFETLRRQGKVRAVVGFAYSGEFADVVAEAPGMAGVAGFFNMMEHHLYGVLPRIRASGRSLVAMRPFCGGILTQKRSAWDALPDGDRLKLPVLREPFRQREELGRMFGEMPAPFEAVALRYVLSFPETATCIVGLDSPGQVAKILELISGAGPFDNRAEQVHALFRAQSADSRRAAFHSTKGWQE